MLCTQLLFYASLFDEHKIITVAESNARKSKSHSPARMHGVLTGVLPMTIDDIIRVLESNQSLLRELGAVVTKHLERSARRWVDLSNLFSFMSVQ